MTDFHDDARRNSGDNWRSRGTDSDSNENNWTEVISLFIGCGTVAAIFFVALKERHLVEHEREKDPDRFRENEYVDREVVWKKYRSFRF